MDKRRAFDQRVRDVAGFERFVGAAIGEEAAFTVRVDECDQPPGLMGSIADEIRRDADRLEPRRLAFDVGGPDARDKIDARAVVGEPRRLIGCGTARLNGDRCASVRAARQRPFGTNDDVGHDVADQEYAGAGTQRASALVGGDCDRRYPSLRRTSMVESILAM